MLIHLPFAALDTKISPEGFWSGVRRAVGIRDIEVESTLFNKRFRVTGNDKRFAVALLDQEMLAWLLSPDSSGGAVKFELWGSWLLCVSGKLEMEQMFGFLDWGQSVPSRMPGVLGSLYPLSWSPLFSSSLRSLPALGLLRLRRPTTGSSTLFRRLLHTSSNC